MRSSNCFRIGGRLADLSKVRLLYEGCVDSSEDAAGEQNPTTPAIRMGASSATQRASANLSYDADLIAPIVLHWSLVIHVLH